MSSILELNPWKSKEELFLEKTGQKKINFETNLAVENGIQKEPIARSFFNQLVNANFKDTVFVSEELNFMRASLDGYDEEKKEGVEIKCPFTDRSFNRLCQDIPNYYYCQLQHQMFCAGLNEIYFFIYKDDKKNYFRIVPRNKNFIGNMKKKCDEFWSRVLEFSEKNW